MPFVSKDNLTLIRNKINSLYVRKDSQYEANLLWGGKNFSGSFGPIDASMIQELGPNRFAFAGIAGVTLEYTRDGSTWTALSDDTLKKQLFSTGGSFYIGNYASSGIDKSKYGCRVTIRTSSNFGNIYSVLNKFAIYLSTEGSTGCWCTIEARTELNRAAGTNTWIKLSDKTEVSGWSGWNIINTSNVITHGNDSSQYSEIRFTFGVTSHLSTSAYTGLNIKRIMAFGGVGWTTPSNLARNGHIYSYDYDQNVGFPASVTAASFIGNGSYVTSLNGSNISSGTVAFARLPTGTTSSTVAIGDHTHTTSLATDTGTSAISLSAGGKYRLTAGGTSVIFTMPSDSNTYGRSGDTSSKIYLIGRTSQSTSNGTTYSHDTVYVDTDGCLRSGGTKVSVEGHTHSYLPLSGGTMTGVGQITNSNTGGMWVEARAKALLRHDTYTSNSSYSPILSCKTSVGEISNGIIHPEDRMVWNYTTDDNFNTLNNSSSQLMQLNTAGDLTVLKSVSAPSFTATSDKRLKENIRPWVCDKNILDLEVKKFDFINGLKDQVGCLAQDLQEICPELVKEREDGYLSIQESKIVYLLLLELKNMKKHLNELERKIN